VIEELTPGEQARLLDHAHILVRNLDDRIIFWSSALLAKYGFSKDEAMGTLSHDLLKTVFPEELSDIRSRLMKEGFWEGKLEHTTKSGSKVIVASRWTLFSDSQGKPYILETNSDITVQHLEGKERDNQLMIEERSRREMEQANKAKDEFLATLSHELRSPLTSIVGWAHILRNEDARDHVIDKALESIERSAKLQVKLIDELLDLSRIITGKLHLEFKQLEIREIVDTALENIIPSAEEKGVRVRKVVSVRPVQVLGDPERLQQVLLNLLSNAIKFTPEGGLVEVSTEVENNRVNISVKDTGVGIDPELLPHVFDRFRQSDLSKVKGGLGLGLAVVKNLVDIHGGSVKAISGGQDKGAIFTISLPIEARKVTPMPEIGPKMDGKAEPAIDELTILLVEDEPDALSILKTILEQSGASVLAASSAAEAFRYYMNTSVDLILSDISMPGEDGLSLIKRIREAESKLDKYTPAAALTALAGQDNRMRILDSGFQMHITKPICPEDLIKKVRQLAEFRNQKLFAGVAIS
jgi:PAS domain S-box-containing protein